MGRCLMSLATLLVLGAADPHARVDPVGLWNFDDPQHLLHADIGLDLTMIGRHQFVPGTHEGDGAARIGLFSHYVCQHLIPPGENGFVDAYTIVFDIYMYGRGLYHCLLQTDELNWTPADVLIDPSGAVGEENLGFACPRLLDARKWYRVAAVVENGRCLRFYADGFLLLEADRQPAGGRYALSPTVCFFGDGLYRDNEIDVSRIALYDRALEPDEVVALGSLGGMSIFLTPPYLQNVKPDGISVLWETENGANSWLEFGADSTYGQVIVPTVAASGFGSQIHTAILTDLTPATPYCYRVVVDSTQCEAAFVTAPGGPADFVFGVWGDSQGTNRNMYPRDPTEPARSIFKQMSAEPFAFAVGCGDFAEVGNSYTDVHMYFLDRVAATAGRHQPLYFAWGNHDVGSHALIRKFADLPSKDRGEPFTAGFGSYAFDYGGCHFICIDFLMETGDIPGWLETDLRSPEAQNARLTFLFIHRPPYIERWYDGQENLRADLVPLLEEYGVDACFAGHLHEYERGRSNGVDYAVVGNTCWLCWICPLVRDWPHMTVGGYDDIQPGFWGGLVDGYLRVAVTGDTYTADFHAFANDGSPLGVFDSFGSNAQSAGRICDVSEGRLRYRNPYTPFDSIVWTAPNGSRWDGQRAASETAVLIHALDGRLVRRLAPSPVAGAPRFRWDGRDADGRAAPAAIYFLQMNGRPEGTLAIVR